MTTIQLIRKLPSTFVEIATQNSHCKFWLALYYNRVWPTFRDWHHGGQFNAMLCVDCRLHYKKYGYDKVIEDRPPTPIQLKELREAKKEVQEQVK